MPRLATPCCALAALLGALTLWEAPAAAQSAWVPVGDTASRSEPPELGPTGPLEPPDDPELDAAEKRTNFAYGEMSSRLEKVIIGRRKKGRKTPPRSGVTPADRVEKGDIRYIVLHSALGSYEGSIDHLLRKPVAAHFMVGKDGAVTRMVAIKDLANHVKNPQIERASVGIETETGRMKPPWFSAADWDPGERWRMYAALAWLIRAIAEEAGVPRDTEHIIGHDAADRGLRGAHTDPGELFYNASYPLFEERFPGRGVTPQKYLMLLVNDDTPPRVERPAAAAAAMIRVKDLERLGVSRVKLLQAEGGRSRTVYAWQAGAKGMPPSRVDVPLPPEPGDYGIEAYDLVGNMTRARFVVSAPAEGPPLLSFLSDPEGI